MAAKTSTWMPMYWGDYVRDTMHLRTLEHGAYMLLIGAYWVGGQPLPDDDNRLSAITRLEQKAWMNMRPAIAAFFSIGNGMWRHKRIDAELDRSKRLAELKQTAGKKGGKRKAENAANGQQAPKQTPTPSPSQSQRSSQIASQFSSERPARAEGDASQDEAEPLEAPEFATLAEAEGLDLSHEIRRFYDYLEGQGETPADLGARFRGFLTSGKGRRASGEAPKPKGKPVRSWAERVGVPHKLIDTRDDQGNLNGSKWVDIDGNDCPVDGLEPPAFLKRA